MEITGNVFIGHICRRDLFRALFIDRWNLKGLLISPSRATMVNSTKYPRSTVVHIVEDNMITIDVNAISVQQEGASDSFSLRWVFS